MKQKYKVGDFDYFIIEIGGVRDGDTEKYLKQFCIIPSEVLKDQGILQDKNCKGKSAFCVCPPDYTKPHWSKEYWNKIPKELLVKNT